MIVFYYIELELHNFLLYFNCILYNLFHNSISNCFISKIRVHSSVLIYLTVRLKYFILETKRKPLNFSDIIKTINSYFPVFNEYSILLRDTYIYEGDSAEILQI